MDPEGNKCVDVDECLSSPCAPEAEKCENTDGLFLCTCANGYERNDQAKCVPASDAKYDSESESDSADDPPKDEL